MSIESNLKSIAESLAVLATVAQANQRADSAAPVQAAPVQAAPVQAAPVQAAPVQAAPVQAAPVQAAPVQAAPVQAAPATHAVTTPEDLNEALVAELARLGGDQHMTKILSVLNAAPFNAVGIKELTVEQYQPLLEKVRAIPA